MEFENILWLLILIHIRWMKSVSKESSVASRPGRFNPRKRDPGTHWIGGWVGLTAVLDAVEKRKIPSLLRKSNPRTPNILIKNAGL
jgi:hypothetical protein